MASKVLYIEDHLVQNDKLCIGLMETWLRDHFEGEIKIERTNKMKWKYGRVAFYMKGELSASFESVVNYYDDAVDMRDGFSKKDNLFLVVMYRLPDNPIRISTSREFEIALMTLSDSINRLTDNTVPDIILGDFNLPRATEINTINIGFLSDQLSMIKLLE